jgi:exoribonuclease-2
VIRVWVDARGLVVKSNICREAIRVQQRLHYKDVDVMLKQGNDETSQQLRNLLAVAESLQNQRILEGAFNLQRPEYKVSLKNNVVSVELIEVNSPSRLLVAEMMILSNHIAAKYAQRHQVPIIYRTQEAPLELITADMLADLNPINFNRIRKLLRASTLSLQPAAHSGLGLSVYTQLSSPLRRFADLVMQRQLVAHVVGEELPYNQEELYKVLATAERTAREARRAENEAKKRWFMLHLKQSWSDKPLEVFIIEAVKGGYKVEMLPWGVDAFLGTSRTLTIGEKIWCMVDKIRVKAASARLKLIPKNS